MPWSEMIVMVAVVAAVALAAIQLLRLVATAIMHQTIRKTIDRDPSAAEPLLTRLTAPVEPKGGDDRTATLLIALGIAIIAASVIIGDTRWMHYGVAGAVFPLFIGTALWLRHYALNRSRRTDRADQQ